ncbi:MAG: uncharacterized protein KVP18_001949 [Porospora cf. gigantea A]|uniref:uncharacterized protein n=1 Tax=Porospora cf. gigantea A TaxID=2853593 RepID=UPI003559C554|nr:MAG: hypothetical protein KVP18_001949 [Porospora cf. gigantea A]
MSEVFIQVPFSLDDYPLGKFRQDLTQAIGCGDKYLKNVRKLRCAQLGSGTGTGEGARRAGDPSEKEKIGARRPTARKTTERPPVCCREMRFYEARRCGREMERLTKLKFVSAADYYARRMKDIADERESPSLKRRQVPPKHQLPRPKRTRIPVPTQGTEMSSNLRQKKCKSW